MKSTVFVFGLALAATAALGLQGVQSTLADEKEYKPKVDIKGLVEEPLHGVDGKKVIIKRFDIPGGHVGGKHMHPGPVYVYVLDGELTVNVEGREPHTIKAGELYSEPIGSVMQARNPHADKGVKILVFQVGDADKPMMIKAK